MSLGPFTWYTDYFRILGYDNLLLHPVDLLSNVVCGVAIDAGAFCLLVSSDVKFVAYESGSVWSIACMCRCARRTTSGYLSRMSAQHQTNQPNGRQCKKKWFTLLKIQRNVKQH